MTVAHVTGAACGIGQAIALTEMAPRLSIGAQSPVGIDRAARPGDGVTTLATPGAGVESGSERIQLATLLALVDELLAPAQASSSEVQTAVAWATAFLRRAQPTPPERADTAPTAKQLSRTGSTAIRITPGMMTHRARLTVLGSDRPRWTVIDEAGHVHARTLTGRHADILVLLHQHPEGATADRLALLLDDADLKPVTVRAEMTRLRRTIGTQFLGSRPYRLLKPITSDLGDILGALNSGDVDTALSQYRGPLLPESLSPAIARLRTELSTGLGSAAIAAGRVSTLRRWLQTPEGRDDHHAWQILHQNSSVRPVIRAAAAGHLAGIDLEFS